jgi:hypothetical protein
MAQYSSTSNDRTLSKPILVSLLEGLQSGLMQFRLRTLKLAGVDQFPDPFVEFEKVRLRNFTRGCRSGGQVLEYRSPLTDF